MNAVSKIETNTRQLAPLEEVQGHIANMGTQLKSVLPTHIDPAKFQRVAMTAIQGDPDLLLADRASLYTALTKAATDGLLPDKREGALTIANTKFKINGREEWRKLVVWMPMVAGVVKKIRQSGEVIKMIAKAVYEKDEFDVLFGDDDRIYHKPFMDGHPGKIIGAYSIVHLKDGSISRDFLPKWRIDKAKAVAKTKFVWDAWEDEMSIKTVIRHHAKLLPQSTDIEAAFTNDDTQQFDMAAAMLAGPQAAPQPLSGAMLLAQANGDDVADVGAAASEDDPNRVSAEGWMSRSLAAIEAAADRVSMGALLTRRGDTLENVREHYPDIAARWDAAWTARLAAFDAADGAGADDNAAAPDDDDSWRTNPMNAG